MLHNHSEIRKFFEASFLEENADPNFQKEIQRVENDNSAKIFLPEDKTLTVTNVKTKSGKKLKKVTVEGIFKTILRGTPIDELPVRLTILIDDVPTNATNPFGYQVVGYSEKKINKTEKE